MSGRVLQLVAVGNFPPEKLAELQEPLVTHMQVSVVVGKTHLQTPTYAFNKDRGQYHSNAVMRRLVPLLEPGSRFVMGVTNVDLFIPDSPFIFGEADRESRAALISTFRLNSPVADTFKRRLQVEAVHQAGHLVGLSYCEDPRCVMFLAPTPADCDRKGLVPCNLCRNELMKLNR